MDLDAFIVEVFCLIEDGLKELPPERPVRSRGPAPVLADSEVLTMEAVGAYLGLARDVAIYRYFRRHSAAFFPALRRVHRTAFARQAANLWAAKERLWQRLLGLVPHDPAFSLVNGLPRIETPREQRLAELGRDLLSAASLQGDFTFRCNPVGLAGRCVSQ